jgi:hypothetical protein
MILGWHGIEPYTSLGQYRTDAHLVAVAERGLVFADDVLAKTGSVFDAEDTADSSSCGTYSSSDDCADWTCRSVAGGRPLFSAPDRSLRIRGQWQTHDDEGGNGKGFYLHVRSFQCERPTTYICNEMWPWLTQNVARRRRFFPTRIAGLHLEQPIDVSEYRAKQLGDNGDVRGYSVVKTRALH